MQVENIDGLTREDISTLLEYMELMTAALEETPDGMDKLGGKLLENPDLFFKIEKFLMRD